MAGFLFGLDKKLPKNYNKYNIVYDKQPKILFSVETPGAGNCAENWREHTSVMNDTLRI